MYKILYIYPAQIRYVCKTYGIICAAHRLRTTNVYQFDIEFLGRQRNKQPHIVLGSPHWNLDHRQRITADQQRGRHTTEMQSESISTLRGIRIPGAVPLFRYHGFRK